MFQRFAVWEETSVFSQGKVPSHLVESTIPPFGKDLILVTFGYDEGISSCGQIKSLDGIDSNANDQQWLTQWGLLLKHHHFTTSKPARIGQRLFRTSLLLSWESWFNDWWIGYELTIGKMHPTLRFANSGLWEVYQTLDASPNGYFILKY